RSGLCSGERRDGWDAGGDRCTADRLFVKEGVLPAGSIDDELDPSPLDQVDDVRPALLHLENAFDDQAGGLERVRRSLGGDDLETKMDVAAGEIDGGGLVMVVHAEENRTAGRQHLSRRELRLGEGLAESGSHAHYLAGGLHLRPENGIDARKLVPRKDRRLDVIVRARSKVPACGELLRQKIP